MTENFFECGKCEHFDGMFCTIDNKDRDADEVVCSCTHFSMSIYYE